MVTVAVPPCVFHYYDEEFTRLWFPEVTNPNVGDVVNHKNGVRYEVTRVRRSKEMFLRCPVVFVYVRKLP